MRNTHRALAIGFIAAATSGLNAQAAPEPPEDAFSPPRLMVGFVINGPEQFLGGGGAWLPRFLGGWGIYLDYKADTDSPAESEDFVAISAEEALEAGDDRRITDHSYRSLNAALVRAYDSDVVFYLGGGVSEESTYSRFFDSTLTRGSFGHYWAEHAQAGGVRANVLGGMFFRLGQRFAVQFGAEAVPPGVTVGFHLTL